MMYEKQLYYNNKQQIMYVNNNYNLKVKQNCIMSCENVNVNIIFKLIICVKQFLYFCTNKINRGVVNFPMLKCLVLNIAKQKVYLNVIHFGI